MFGVFHFTVRAVSLFVIGLSCCFLIQRNDVRADMTAERLSTLSPETLKLLREIKVENPVIIEAFISPNVPEPYIQTVLNVRAVLGEIASRCKNSVTVKINEIKPHTQEALNAAQRYDIRPQPVRFAARGTLEQSDIFLGIAFRYGLKTVTLPFIDRGLSAEYELVHALSSIVDPTRKRVGILVTDAPLMGGVDYSTFLMRPSWRIVDELRKQYTVVEVDPREPIVEKYDALLAIQPSSLGPQEMQNFVGAIRNGQPAVIFEDPMPLPGFSGDLPGTAAPRRAPGGGMAMMMQQQSPPKGDITLLWELLDVSLNGDRAVWQDYNPIRKIASLPKGFVFVDRTRADEQNAPQPFDSKDAISSDIQYMMFAFPGSVKQSTRPNSKITFSPLVKTFRDPAGYVTVSNLRRLRSETEIERYYEIEPSQSELAVHIQGELPPLPSQPLEEGQTPPKPEPVKLNVVLIADVDMISNGMFELRSRGTEPGSGINLNFDNVTFVLNAIDSVTDDTRYLTVRGRRPAHRTLQEFDRQTATIRDDASSKRSEKQKEFDAEVSASEEELKKTEEELRKQYKSGNVGENEATVRILTKIASIQKKMMESKEQKERELEIALEEADVELNKRIHAIQSRYKFLAVAIPPIPPLLIGLIVLIIRRSRETEGVPKTRRRK
jgi:ABC-2 type transport system permease protein